MDGGIYVENRKRKLSLESLSSEDPLDRSRTSVLPLSLRKERRGMSGIEATGWTDEKRGDRGRVRKVALKKNEIIVPNFWTNRRKLLRVTGCRFQEFSPRIVRCTSAMLSANRFQDSTAQMFTSNRTGAAYICI